MRMSRFTSLSRRLRRLEQSTEAVAPFKMHIRFVAMDGSIVRTVVLESGSATGLPGKQFTERVGNRVQP
jgi:hypothetical protein